MLAEAEVCPRCKMEIAYGEFVYKKKYFELDALLYGEPIKANSSGVIDSYFLRLTMMQAEVCCIFCSLVMRDLFKPIIRLFQ